MNAVGLSIQSISVYQFKNYFQRDFQFTSRITGICGKNGVGKTNLLDAIYYLCFTKSYFTRQDNQNVQQGHQGFRIEGKFTLNDTPETAVCIMRETGKKEFQINGDGYERFSKHIGRYPAVIIAPDDIQLILGISEDRRKFLDTILSQLDSDYLQSLIQYNRILLQRNSFLRNFGESFSKDLSVLDILDTQIQKEGDIIYGKRSSFALKYLPLVKQLYSDISQVSENINLYYESELAQMSMAESLQLNRQRDLVTGRTTSGIHRDDLLFKMGEQPFKSSASQGQRKSLLFAMKLAEMDLLKEQKRISPILLLDDVFEKLDEERIANLLLRVSEDPETQIFITDTNCSRLEAGLSKLNSDYSLIRL